MRKLISLILSMVISICIYSANEGAWMRDTKDINLYRNPYTSTTVSTYDKVSDVEYIFNRLVFDDYPISKYNEIKNSIIINNNRKTHYNPNKQTMYIADFNTNCVILITADNLPDINIGIASYLILLEQIQQNKDFWRM